jgi:hypothetical protein
MQVYDMTTYEHEEQNLGHWNDKAITQTKCMENKQANFK